MNPVEFIILADAMGGTKESENRAAIGRYYYGVFNRLKNELAASHSVAFPETGLDHALVKNNVGKLDTTPAGTTPTAQTLLTSLHDLRKKADYKLGAAVTAGDRANAKLLSDDIRRMTGGW